MHYWSPLKRIPPTLIVTEGTHIETDTRWSFVRLNVEPDVLLIHQRSHALEWREAVALLVEPPRARVPEHIFLRRGFIDQPLLGERHNWACVHLDYRA